jgi:hypothetical protein
MRVAVKKPSVIRGEVRIIRRLRMTSNAMYERPTLFIERNGSAPPPPAATDPAATLWCDHQGTVGALSHTVAGKRWLHVLEVASFRLEPTHNRVLAVPCAGADPDTIFDEFERTVWPTLLQLKGCEVLHASAVRTAQGVVAFCAPSNTGKSTLAHALSERGYPLWVDDALAAEGRSEGVLSYPLASHVRLRPSSASYFGLPLEQAVRGRVRRAVASGHKPLPLLAVYVLERATQLPNGEVMRVEPLPAPGALAELLKHALFFSQDTARKRQMIAQYAQLVNRVPVLRLRFRAGFDAFPSVLDALEARIQAQIRAHASLAAEAHVAQPV